MRLKPATIQTAMDGRICLPPENAVRSLCDVIFEEGLAELSTRGGAVVLQVGFGSGAYFFETWRRWREESRRNERLFFIALEDAPYTAAEHGMCLWKGSPWESFAQELAAQWPVSVSGLHRLEFDGGRVILMLGFGNKEGLLQRIKPRVDVFLIARQGDFLAPFSRIRELSKLASKGTLFVADELFEQQKTDLSQAGFAISQNAREGSVVGRFIPERREGDGRLKNWVTKKAVVIGAGLAGTAAAASLAKRGWDVTVIERRKQAGLEASGNFAGVMSPMISKDDGLAARLSRASFLALRAELLRLESSTNPARWAACGVVQLAKDSREEAAFRAIQETGKFPDSFVRVLTRAEAAEELGHEVEVGGLFFPGGGWVNPPSLCEARLSLFSSIRRIFSCEVLEFRRVAGEWEIVAESGIVVERAPVVVLANAFEAKKFQSTQALHFKKVRGQVTHLPEVSLPRQNRVVCRDGYLAPAIDGICCLGATYDFNNDNPEIELSGHEENLKRLEAMSLCLTAKIEISAVSGRVGFRCLTPDRMPVVGALPDFGAAEGASFSNISQVERQPGLYGLLGLGSRGLVWSALMGEILAAEIDSEPMPVEEDLIRSIDPARFLVRAGRH